MFILLSCTNEKMLKPNEASNPFIDSLSFKHYKKKSIPYLLSSTTYAYNDSMSQVLDTLSLDRLNSMNSTDRSYDDPLSYERFHDTIVVDLIYSRGKTGFAFGEIKISEDSIFMRLSGEVYKEIPKISPKSQVSYRYYRTEFKILADTSRDYSIFFRHDDSFESKH